jgi:hypothetical protein
LAPRRLHRPIHSSLFSTTSPLAWLADRMLHTTLN